MLYINESDIEKIGIKWDETCNIIEYAVNCIHKSNYVQPIKPYLRYKKMKNRIIAMPAYIGGRFDIAGIKWISSFPDNINNNLPRAHSVVVLNEADTGIPLSIINTPLLSIIRTASVSSLVIKKYLSTHNKVKYKLGIVGFGPIGQSHLNMCLQLFNEKLSNIKLFDINTINMDIIENQYKHKVKVVNSWEEVYIDSDIFITCTVSDHRYIDKKPNEGSLLLNVSLRDYKPDIYEYIKDSIIVVDCEEACRENTDIELMYNDKGLRKENIATLTDIVCENYMEKYNINTPIMFNPMGMAVFDIAIGEYYYNKSKKMNYGVILQ